MLLVEDEPEMAELTLRQIRAAGYVVDHASTIEEAMAAIAAARHALLVVDRRLPDGDGVTLMPYLRDRRPGTPVILLSALADLDSKVDGLDAGADDYLTKPYQRDELLARIRAALRRPGAERSPPIRCGRLTFLPDIRQFELEGVPMVLKRRELALLEALIRRVGRVAARDSLMEEIYGFDDEVQTNALEALVCRLRARLTDLDSSATIHTVRGVGYMLDAI